MTALPIADENRLQSGGGSRLYFDRDEAAAVVDNYMRFLKGGAAELFKDKSLTDVYVNPGDTAIWVNGIHGKQRTQYRQRPEDTEQFISSIVSYFNVEFSQRFPYFERVLPFNGSRFTAFTAPFTPKGTGWVVRLPVGIVPTLQEYIDAGIIESQEMAKKIRGMLVQRRNLLIGGEMGSGKSTLLNALLGEIVALDKGKSRFALVEDCDEMRCDAEDYVKLNVDENITIGGVPMDWGFAIKRALRLSLNRIMVGEIRSHASVILDAWRTGHPGNLASIHGGDAQEVMGRFEFLLRREHFPVDRHEIAKTIHGVIVMKKVGAGRIVREVKRIEGVNADGSGYIFS